MNPTRLREIADALSAAYAQACKAAADNGIAPQDAYPFVVGFLRSACARAASELRKEAGAQLEGCGRAEKDTRKGFARRCRHCGLTLALCRNWKRKAKKPSLVAIEGGKR